ncbi:DUF4435 domain-containing protein [Lonsdalea quercina]|uniref:DUF4435 domain-containing protein n=1 Tax=Lonsdalea quercina TaxID=71657 RepID=UPI0039763004
MSKGLIRSSKALSVMKRFNRVALVLYVEGPTDKVFWKTLLEINSIENIKIHIAGSCTALDEYIKSIVNDGVDIFVARDKDYKYHTNQLPNHDRIILTYGHSIENSLVFEKSLSDMASTYGGDPVSCNKFFLEWKKDTINSLFELVLREFSNEMSDSRISILGDHCDRFLKKNRGLDVIPKKIISDFIFSIDSNFSHENIMKARDICISLGDELFWFIRGHFVFSLAIKFMKKLIKRIRMDNKEPTIVNEMFFCILVNSFKHHIIRKEHPHIEHYDMQINKIKKHMSV